MDNKNTAVSASVPELIALESQGKQFSLAPVNRARSPLSGNRISGFKGKGMDFTESRPYQPGDDARRIDWRVTARTGKPHTKLYIEERERPVFIFIDYSASMFFGSRVCFKTVTAARAAALLAWSAVSNQDRIGSVISTDQGIIDNKPCLGHKGALALIDGIVKSSQQLPINYGLKGHPNGFLEGLKHLKQVAHPGSLIVVLSDFFSLDRESERLLKSVKKHTDMMILEISDSLEFRAPSPGRYAVSDGDDTLLIDTMSNQTRTLFTSAYQSKHDRILTLCRELNVQHIGLSNEQDIPLIIKQHFARRPSRRRIR